MEGPYRSTKIRGGVALPRRAQAWWQVAVGLAALTWLLVIGSFAATELREEATFLQDRLGWFFSLGALILVVIGPLSSAIVTGRSTGTTRALGFALAPALLAELWGATRFPAWKLPSITEQPHAVGADVVLDIASARVGCYAITSVTAFTVAIACTGSVLGVRQEIKPAPLWPSFVVVLASLVFAGVRLRDWHRDGFVGALPVFGLLAGAVLAPLLRSRVRALSDWHDAEERRTTEHGAWVALFSIAVATLAAERTLLAYEESRDVTALRRWAYTFETRYEVVHRLVGSIHAHHLALAILGVAFVAMLASAAKDLAPRHRVGWVVVAMSVGVVALSASTERRVLGMLVEPPGPTVPSGVELPLIDQEPGRPALLKPRKFLPLVEQSEPAERPIAFVGDRRQPTRHLFAVTRGWRGGGLGVIATGGPAPTGLGPWLALIGPRWAMVEVEIGTLENMKSGRGLVVLEEAGTARLRVLGGQVLGMPLRKDVDAQRQRLRIGVELGTFASVLVAPSPTGDIQSLVDLLAAVRDVARTHVIVTSDYQDAADTIGAR